MKYLLIFVVLYAFVFTSAAQNQTFTVKGEFNGMQKGDTLIVREENATSAFNLMSDTLIITKNNSFVYKLKNDGARFYTLEYHPKSGKMNLVDYRMLIFLGKGTVKLKGDAEHFSTAKKSGADYDHPQVARYTYLKDSAAMAVNKAYAIYEKAQKDKDADKMKSALTTITTGGKNEAQDQIYLNLCNEAKDSEFAAALYYWNSTLFSSASLQKRLDSFTPEVKDSYTGQLILKSIDRKKAVEAGALAPDFTVTDKEERKFSLADYKGKYLLLFHWGVTAESFQMNPIVEQLYTIFNPRGLEIVDLVERTILPDNFLAYSVDVYKQLNPLLHHPWTTIYTSSPENHFIIDKYRLDGLPLMMLISPDGKILARSFGDLREIVKILRTEMPDNGK